MSSVADVLNAQSGISTAASSSASNGLGKDDFLKLLVTQLSNQDPLSPMQNEEFVAQLAQFSGLEQLVGVNQRLDGLTTGQSAQNSSTAVNFIGKNVRAMADWTEYDGQTPDTLSFELTGQAQEVTVTITDDAGNQVRKESLKDGAKGTHAWIWDGRNQDGSPQKAGTYHVSISAKDENGNDVTGFATAEGRITGVTFEKGYPELMIGSHQLTLADVIEIKE
jgi:flagellar basal-body rod modification protein FlgD